MLVSTQQSISVLNKWKEYLSQLKNYFQSNGLYKEGVESLYKEINDNLSSTGIEINESKKQYLKNISDDFNSRQNYDSDSTQFKFVVKLINDILKNINGRKQQEQNPRQERTASIRRRPNALPIEQRMPMEERPIATEPINIVEHINTLQNKQDALQQQLDKVKEDKPSIIRIRKHIRYNQEKSDLKSTLHKASEEKWETIIKNNEDTLILIKEERSINDRIQKLEDHIEALKQDLNDLLKDKKILRSEEGEYDSTKKTLKSQLHEASKEKWKVKLDQTFEEKRNTPLNEVADRTGSRHIRTEIQNNNYTGNFRYKNEEGEVRSIGKIADRFSSNAQDLGYGHKDKYADWKILFKNQMDEIETLLADKKLPKEDKKALEEIKQDLQKDKENNDKHTRKLIKTGEVSTVFQGASLQLGLEPRGTSTASVLMF